MTSPLPKSSYWLANDAWLRIQNYLPITCVDVLPFRLENNKIREFGLILRNTPHQGDRWCLIGGRLQYKELLKDGVAREIIEALGDKITYNLISNEPVKVVQYMPGTGIGEYFDPRKHAIGLTYAVKLAGSFVPQGEALDFKWFPISQVHEMKDIGFGQQRIIIDCLQYLAPSPLFPE